MFSLQYIITGLKGLLAITIAIALGTLMYVHFNKEDLSRRVLAAMQNQVTTGLEIRDFRIDLMTYFPYVAGVMRDVQLEGTTGETMIAAERVAVLIRPWEFLGGEIEVSKLILSKGAIAVAQTPEGLSLNVFGKNESGSNDPGMMLRFKKILLDNVAFTYTDVRRNQKIDLHFDAAEFKGKFGYDLISFDVDGAFTSQMIDLNGDRYAERSQCTLEGDVSIDLKRRLYTFGKLKLWANGQCFKTSGTIRSCDQHDFYDLTIDHPKGDVGRLIAIIPQRFQAHLASLPVSGELEASASISGRMNARENPEVKLQFSTALEYTPAENITIDINATGNVDNGGMHNLRTSTLEISSIDARSDHGRFRGSITLSRLDDPVMTVSGKGVLPAVALNTWLPDNVRMISGRLQFDDIRSEPVWLDPFDFTDLAKLTLESKIEQTVFAVNSREYTVGVDSLVWHQGVLSISRGNLETGGQEVAINGELSRLHEAIEANDAGKAGIDLSLTGQGIDAATLMASFRNMENSHQLVMPVTNEIRAPVRMPSGNISMDFRRLRYETIVLDSLHLDVQTTLHEAMYEGAFQTAKGKVDISGTLATGDVWRARSKWDCRDLDVRQCFAQFGNFGQETLTTDHISGLLSAQVYTEMAFDQNGAFLQDDLNLLAGMIFSNGQLTDFRLLEQFSRYIHVKDLRDIHFEHLMNFIEIRHGKVFLPTMFIQSNAANLMVNGVHSFDNEILYNLKLNAGQILANKMKQHDPSLAPVPARKEGTFNMHFTISGTMDDFTYKNNKAGVLSSFAQSEVMKSSIRTELEQIFGSVLQIEVPEEWQEIPEYQEEAPGPVEFLDGIEAPVKGQ